MAKAYSWSSTGGLVPVDVQTLATSLSVASSAVTLDSSGITMGADKDIVLSGGGTITGLPSTPSLSSEAASKAYVESYANSVASGLDVKRSVVAATTSPLASVTYDNGTSGVNATLTADANGNIGTIDGVTLSIGDRILVKDQAAPEENGIYTVSALGGIATPFALTRASDADTGGASGEVTPGLFCFIEQGTTNGDTGWVLSSPDAAVTMGTTELVFTQFSSGAAIAAGAGLTKTGNTLDVVSANSAIVVNANDIELTLATDSGLEIATGLKVNLDSNPGLVLGAGGIKLDFTTLASGAGTFSVANDLIPISQGGVAKYVNISQLASSMAGNGLAASSGVLSLSLSELTDTAIDVANDFIAFIDASDSNASVKESVADFVQAFTGSGLSAASGVVSVDVDDATIEVGGSGLQVVAGGIGTSQLANGAVNGAKSAVLSSASGLVSNASMTAPEMKVAIVNTSTNKVALFDTDGAAGVIPAGLMMTDTVGAADVAVDLYTTSGALLTIPSAARAATNFDEGKTVYAIDGGILSTNFADLTAGDWTCPVGVAVGTDKLILRIGTPFQA